MFSRKPITSAATIFAAALASASILPAVAHAGNDQLAEQVSALVEASYPADGPGAAVIVTENGEVIYAGGQGLADVEAGTPITADTVFRFASISKQFAAATVLKLAEQGKLSLDDPLSKFLPDYPAPGANATVRQLLNHTSGIKSYTGIAGWMTEENTSKAFTTDELIAEFADQDDDFAAGEAFAYNNSGYVLLGAIIEKVTGETWHGAIVSQISKPHGLTTIAGFHDEATLPRMAKGYTAGEEGAAVPAQKIHANVPHAAGGLRGNVGDLARWAAALHGGEVLSENSYQQMIAPTQLPEGKSEQYGYGIAPDEVRGRDAIGHSGGIFGFSTDSIYLPEEGVFVAVLANSDRPATGPNTMMRRLAALAIDDPYQQFTAVDADLEALADKFGVYRISEDSTRKFYAQDGKLFTQRSGGSPSEIFAAGEGRFFYGPSSLTWFKISANEDGTPTMEMHQNGAKTIELATYDGPIVEAEIVDVSRATLESYVGNYTSPIGPLTISLTDEDVLMAQLGGQPAIALAPLSETEFQVTVVDATVTFSREGGAVTGLTIAQGGQEFPATRDED